MGYNYKIIDKRRQEAPFLILEKNIYENLNVGTLAVVSEKYDTGYRLKILPKGEYINSEYTSSGKTYSKGDLVLVVFLDNYGTVALDDKTSPIMHDYKNAVIIGKVSLVKDNPEPSEIKRYAGYIVNTDSNQTAIRELILAHPNIRLWSNLENGTSANYFSLNYIVRKNNSTYTVELYYVVNSSSSSSNVSKFGTGEDHLVYYEYFE